MDLSILKTSNIVNVSVSTVIHNQNKVLLIKEKEGWNFPSGKVNVNENLFHAAIREAAEESGVKAELEGVISIYNYKTRNNSYDKKFPRITFRFNFLGKYISDNGFTHQEQETVLQWFEQNELAELVKADKFRNWIAKQLAEDILKNQVYPLDILLVK